MKLQERDVFSACLILAVAAIGWAYSWYSVTSALFSDLAQFGIAYGSEPYSEIVATTQRHIIGIVSPLVAVLCLCLCAWGLYLFRRPDNDSSPRRSTELPNDEKGGTP